MLCMPQSRRYTKHLNINGLARNLYISADGYFCFDLLVVVEA